MCDRDGDTMKSKSCCFYLFIFICFKSLSRWWAFRKDMMRDTKELKNTKNNLKEKEFTARVGVLK